MRARRIARAACVLALAAFAAAGAPPTKKETPKAPREADLVAALPEDDRLWFTEFAAPILRAEERKAYLELTETYQRDDFREKFWQRRELPELAPPLGPGYRHRYRELKEIVDSRYDGWRSHAGKIVIRFGEPSDVLKPNCQGDEVFRELEVWTYTNLGGSGRGHRRYIFFRPSAGTPLQMWTVLDGDAKVFLPSSCRTGFAELRKDCGGLDKCFPCEDRCRVYRAWEEIRARQGSGAGALIEQASLAEPQPVSTEGLVRDRDKWVTAPKAGAKKIDVLGPGSAAAVISPGAPATPTPTPTAGPVSPEDLARAIAALDARYREFLDLARPLMSESEVSAFAARMSNSQRDEFMRTFWTREKGDDAIRRKNGPPPPRTPGMGLSAKTPARPA